MYQNVSELDVACSVRIERLREFCSGRRVSKARLLIVGRLLLIIKIILRPMKQEILRPITTLPYRINLIPSRSSFRAEAQTSSSSCRNDSRKVIPGGASVSCIHHYLVSMV